MNGLNNLIRSNMENKQTAVNYLIHSIHEDMFQLSKSEVEWKEIFEQAKAMEKQQMFGFTNHHHVIGEGTERFFKEEFELWYNETYGSKGSDETKTDKL